MTAEETKHTHTHRETNTNTLTALCRLLQLSFIAAFHYLPQNSIVLNKRGEGIGAGDEVFQPTNDMWQQLKQHQQQ